MFTPMNSQQVKHNTQTIQTKQYRISDNFRDDLIIL